MAIKVQTVSRIPLYGLLFVFVASIYVARCARKSCIHQIKKSLGPETSMECERKVYLYFIVPQDQIGPYTMLLTLLKRPYSTTNDGDGWYRTHHMLCPHCLPWLCSVCLYRLAVLGSAVGQIVRCILSTLVTTMAAFTSFSTLKHAKASNSLLILSETIKKRNEWTTHSKAIGGRTLLTVNMTISLFHCYFTERRNKCNLHF